MTGPYAEWDMAPLADAYQLHRLWEAPQDAPERAQFIARHAPQVRAIATRGELGASAELIAALPRLELIACYGMGTDAIALAAARERGIRVTNTPDVLIGDVADSAVGLTLALLRGVLAGDAHVRSGAWASGNMALTARLYGKRVGIVGFGRIGSTVARRLSGFDVAIGYFSRTAHADSPQNEPRIDPRFAALDNVLLQPHHASGTTETRRAMGQLVRDNLQAHFAGRPLLTPVA